MNSNYKNIHPKGFPQVSQIKQFGWKVFDPIVIKSPKIGLLQVSQVAALFAMTVSLRPTCESCPESCFEFAPLSRNRTAKCLLIVQEMKILISR